MMDEELYCFPVCVDCNYQHRHKQLMNVLSKWIKTYRYFGYL